MSFMASQCATEESESVIFWGLQCRNRCFVTKLQNVLQMLEPTITEKTNLPGVANVSVKRLHAIHVFYWIMWVSLSVSKQFKYRWPANGSDRSGILAKMSSMQRAPQSFISVCFMCACVTSEIKRNKWVCVTDLLFATHGSAVSVSLFTSYESAWGLKPVGREGLSVQRLDTDVHLNS